MKYWYIDVKQQLMINILINIYMLDSQLCLIHNIEHDSRREGVSLSRLSQSSLRCLSFCDILQRPKYVSNIYR